MGRILAFSFLALIIVLTTGTLALKTIEKLSLLDALYFTVETITTVGYGDIMAQTLEGRIFLIFLMLGGVAVMFYFFGVIMSFIIEGKFLDIHGRKKMRRQIEKLSDHIIVCGAGRVGMQVVKSLLEEKAKFVVIEEDEEKVERMANEGILVITGDATRDEYILLAGIHKAKGLVTTLPDDSHNVYVTLTAKELNPDVHVVSRADNPDSEAKMKRAGADKVVSPATIGGRRMAMSIVNPAYVEYVDFIAKNSNYKILEIAVGSNSPIIGQDATKINLQNPNRINLLAIIRDKSVISILKPGDLVEAGDILILLGEISDLQEIQKKLID